MVLSQDDEMLFDVSVACFLVFLYTTTSRLYFPIEKERGWILAAFSATLCTFIGFYVLHYQLNWDIFHFHWDQKKIMTESMVTRLTVRFFRISNLADVGIGLVQYPSQLFVLTTWIHHGAYILLCCWMVRTRCSILFGICLLEEVPSAIMAYGRLNKRLRSDAWFGFFYFVLRVSFHTWLTWSVLFQLKDDERLTTVRFNFLITEMLHLHWFFSWIRQQTRLWMQSKDVPVVKAE